MREQPLDPRMTVPRLLVQRAEHLGNKPFVRYEDAQLGYADLVQSSEAAAARLAGEFKFEPGTAAAIFLPNGGAFMHCWFASLFAGLVDIPLNHEFKKTGLLFGLQNSQARVVFTDAQGLDALCDAEVIDQLNAIDLIVATDVSDFQPLRQALAGLHKPPHCMSLAELISDGPHLHPWDKLPGTALASVRYTSGTTGLPKGIMHSHLHMLNKARSHNAIMSFTESDLIYSPFPLHHSMSSNNGVMGTLMAGASMVGVRRFSASNYWSDIRANGASLAHILDPMVPLLMKQPLQADEARHRCRMLWAAWPNEAFEERFQTTLLRIYALAEVGVVSSRWQKSPDGSRAAGAVQPEQEVRVVDENDAPLPVGERGEIIIRPREPNRVMMGYRGNLPATMQAFRNLWLHTGDEGFFDEAGELNFLGRVGDSIRRRGVNISSEQIEMEIRRHPSVLECAVVGVPSEFGEEDIQAFVVWQEPPADPTTAFVDLANFLQARLPRQYVPRYFATLTAFDKTQTGKIQKRALRGLNVPERWDREAAARPPTASQ